MHYLSKKSNNISCSVPLQVCTAVFASLVELKCVNYSEGWKLTPGPKGATIVGFSIDDSTRGLQHVTRRIGVGAEAYGSQKHSVLAGVTVVCIGSPLDRDCEVQLGHPFTG